MNSSSSFQYILCQGAENTYMHLVSKSLAADFRSLEQEILFIGVDQHEIILVVFFQKNVWKTTEVPALRFSDLEYF